MFSRRQTPEEAQELAASYADFLLAFGGTAAESHLAIQAAQMIHILDTYEVVFSHGPFLVGVREAADKQPAEKLAMQMFNEIKGSIRE